MKKENTGPTWKNLEKSWEYNSQDMSITVKTYLTMRQVMDNRAVFDVEFDRISIKNLLVELTLMFGPEFKSMVFEENTLNIGPHVRILVNGKHYGTLPDQLNTILTSDDEIGLFPPIAGG
jgi:molybdopterin converting factor small subunit